MTRFVRSATALLLALVLGLTSISMAVARGGMSMSGAMILCVNASQMVVPVGPDGQPLDDQPVCPDCTMGTLALVEMTLLRPPMRRARAVQARAITPIDYIAPTRNAQARGPPVSV